MDDNKKKKHQFAWPFFARRTMWIADGDRLIGEAEELLDDPSVKPYLPNHYKRYRRAARLYEKSALFYRRAGLGVCAKTSYEDAAECYYRIGDKAEHQRSQGLADAIEVYYEEEI